MIKPNETDKYIAGFPAEIRKIMERLRKVIKKAAPGTEEVISYQMPAYRQNRILVYFAGHNGHIGFYPTSSGIEAFRHELTGYKWSKGAIQFPYDQPLPVKLIEAIVKFRVAEDMLKTRSKKQKESY